MLNLVAVLVVDPHVTRYNKLCKNFVYLQVIFLKHKSCNVQLWSYSLLLWQIDKRNFCDIEILQIHIISVHIHMLRRKQNVYALITLYHNIQNAWTREHVSCSFPFIFWEYLCLFLQLFSLFVQYKNNLFL